MRWCELEISNLSTASLLQLVPCVEPRIHPVRKDQNTSGPEKERWQCQNPLGLFYLQGHGRSLWQAQSFPFVVSYPLLHFYQFPLFPQPLLCPSKPQGCGGEEAATVQLLPLSVLSWLGYIKGCKWKSDWKKNCSSLCTSPSWPAKLTLSDSATARTLLITEYINIFFLPRFNTWGSEK